MNQDVLVLLVFLDLLVLKVLSESRVSLVFQVYLVQRDSKGKVDHPDPKVTVEHQVFQESKEIMEKEDHVDQQVNQELLDLKAHLDQRDLKEVPVNRVQ